MNLPNQIDYAHQVRPSEDKLPFEMRAVSVSWRTFKADDTDNCLTYQIVFRGIAISDAEPMPENAIHQASYWLMNQSRNEFDPCMNTKPILKRYWDHMARSVTMEDPTMSLDPTSI